MADVPQPPDLESQSGDSLLATISREMVRAMKQYYGRGPTKAKSYLIDDLLFVVMRGGALQAEKTLLEAGLSDAVREFRQKFENVMAEHLTGAVEQLTERKVVTYQSQVLFEPMVIIEIFVFDQPVSRDAIEETAQALLAGDTGAVGAEDSGAGPA